MSLREDVLDSSSRLSGLSSAQSCAVLLLFDTSLARLAAALGCEALLKVQVPIPPEVCPQLRSVSFVLRAGKFLCLCGSELALFGCNNVGPLSLLFMLVCSHMFREDLSIPEPDYA